MQCQGKISDGLGGHYKCDEEATIKVSIKTFAPHLQKEIHKSRCLCKLHADRFMSRHRYQIKHKGKKSELTKELL